LISTSKKFVFIHIPRTRGTLLSRLLEPYGTALQGEANFDSPYFKHASATDIQRCLGDAFDEYFKFSIVRNPWDWVVSNFAFNRGLHRCYVAGSRYPTCNPNNVPEWAQQMSFDIWLRWWLDELNPGQLSLLQDRSGTILTDRIFRFETLMQDLPSLCERLGVPLVEAISPGPQNRGKRTGSSYRDYYSAVTSDWVETHFQREIELFGYAF
jgi:hypothetical protein